MSRGMRPEGSAKELEARRRRAVELLDQGHPPSVVADRFGVGRGSVTRWRQAREAEGDAGLDAKPHPGCPPKLSDDDLVELETLLLQGPLNHGFPTDLWSLSRIAKVIRGRFDVSLSTSQVWTILRKRMGWSAQKPESRSRERDEKKISDWRKVEWPRIKKRRPMKAEPLSSLTKPG